MSWGAQLLHVAWKDLRLARWPILVWLSALAVTTAIVFLPAADPALALLRMLIAPMGVVLPAMLVQADSPVRDDALWVTRPLAPGAVLGAKLLLVAVAVVGGVTAAQLTHLLALGLPVGELAGALGPAVLGWMAVAAGAALLAALTRDLTTYLVALVVVLVVAQAIAAIGSSHALLNVVGFLGSPAAHAVWTAGAVLVVAAVYHTRDVGVGAWLSAVLAVCVLILPLDGIDAWAARADAGSEAPEPVPDALRLDGLELRDIRLGASTDSEAELHIAFRAGQPDLHYHFSVSTLLLNLPDGTQRRSDMIAPPHLLAYGGPAPLDAGRAPGQPVTATVRMPVDSVTREAIAAGVVVVELRGTIAVHEPHHVATLPVRRGAAAARAGRRLTILDFGVTTGTPSVTARTVERTASVFDPIRLDERGWLQPVLLLRHPSDAEPMALQATRSATSGHGLPGLGLRATRLELTPVPVAGGVAESRGAAWLTGAELSYYEWRAVGTYPVVLRRGRAAAP